MVFKIIFSNFAVEFNKHKTFWVRKIYLILFLVMVACIGCEWHLRPDEPSVKPAVSVERYDQIETRYLTTGDVASLQQMNTSYPRQTRTLIEDLLQLGQVDEALIHTRFYTYFQDSTLQLLLSDVKRMYDDMSDIDKELSASFVRLRKMLPHVEVPVIYAQVGSLDQSIVVGHGMLGISLDKYLGEEYPLYIRYGYTERQRKTMTRDYIVPDCLSFYLLSLYPLQVEGEPTQEQRHLHMGRIQHVVNQAMERGVFSGEYVDQAARLMNDSSLSAHQLLVKE